MDTSKLNESKLNLSSLNVSDLDIDKIRDLIKLLEDHQDKCEKSGRFVEAELSKQRVAQFKKYEDQKLLEEIKQRHQDEKQQMENDQKADLESFNEKWDSQFYEMNGKFTDQEKKLRDEHDEILQKQIEDFNKNYPLQKQSVELLNLNKVIENLVKQKDYTNAHQIQIKIAEHTSTENTKYISEKEKRLNKEIEKIKGKQDNEITVLQVKMQTAYGTFKRERALAFDKLIQKYKNRIKDMDNAQKMEIANFNKTLKGISRPGSRSNNLSMSMNGTSQKSKILTQSVHSTKKSVIQESEQNNEENN